MSLKNHSIRNLKFPNSEFHSGFYSGTHQIKNEYFENWCRENCESLKNYLLENEKVFLEIKVRMDATEQPDNMILVSKKRAEFLKQKLIEVGFPKEKILAKANENTKEFIGKDKFDPVNRTASFQFIEKN